MFTRSTRKVENGPVSTPETDPASVSSRLNYPPPLSSLPQITNDIPRTRLQKRHFLPPPHHPPLFLSRSLCFISEFHPRESILSFPSHSPDQDPIQPRIRLTPPRNCVVTIIQERSGHSRENTLAVKILIFFSSSAEINLPPFHLDRAPPFQAALPSRKNFSKEREGEKESGTFRRGEEEEEERMRTEENKRS